MSDFAPTRDGLYRCRRCGRLYEFAAPRELCQIMDALEAAQLAGDFDHARTSEPARWSHDLLPPQLTPWRPIDRLREYEERTGTQ